jgi:hypothetical protein
MKLSVDKEIKIRATKLLSLRLSEEELEIVKTESLKSGKPVNYVLRHLIKNSENIDKNNIKLLIPDPTIICKAFLDTFSKKMISDKPLSDKQLLSLIDYFISIDS